MPNRPIQSVASQKVEAPTQRSRQQSRSGTWRQDGTSWSQPSVSSRRLCLRFLVQAIDDRALAIRIVLAFEPVVARGELHVRFDEIGSVLDDGLEHLNRFFGPAGLQTETREQLARRE